jgi:hypothetical protein
VKQLVLGKKPPLVIEHGFGGHGGHFFVHIRLKERTVSDAGFIQSVDALVKLMEIVDPEKDQMRMVQSGISEKSLGGFDTGMGRLNRLLARRNVLANKAVDVRRALVTVHAVLLCEESFVNSNGL